MEEIDLYYQPLEHPIAAVSVFFLKSFFITIGIFLCVKVLNVAKKEPNIVTEMVKIFCWTQIIFQPILVFFDLSINLLHPVNEFIGHWYCSLGWFFYSLSTALSISFALASFGLNSFTSTVAAIFAISILASSLRGASYGFLISYMLAMRQAYAAMKFL